MVVEDCADMLVYLFCKCLPSFGIHQHHQSLEYFSVFVEESDLDPSVPEGAVFFMVDTLPDVDADGALFVLPIDFEDVQRWSHQPHLLPLVQGEHCFLEVVAHFLQEVIDGSVAPLKTVEVITQGV